MAVVGIDFGSLGSKIGVARHRGIDIITNEVSNRATPSLVSFGPKQRSIGESAKTQEVSNFKNTIGSLKRLIGRSASDPEITEIEKKFINAELVNTNGTVGVKVKYLKEQHEFSATQLTAMFFGKLRDIASKELKQIVHDVVIAVPGWYTEVQRRAVMDAAAIANLNPLRLINDTTAVALGYGITKSDLPDPENPRFVVFIDVGHSNLSATVVAFSKNQLHVRATAYDRHLGGRDIDFALVRHFATEFKEKYKIDVLSNPKATFRLAAGCEKLKKVLSANFEGNLSVESIMNDIDASSRLNRDQFEALIAPLLDRVTAPILQALSDADITPDKVDAVELVGGSSRVSAIRQRIQSVFPGKALSSTLNQDEAVARGATFQCAMASPVFRVREFSLHDVNAYPIKVHWERSESDPDEDTELVVFSQGNIMPSTKILTFYRNGPFDLEAAYVDPSELPGNPNPFIGKFTAKHTATGEGGDLTAVKVKTRLTANGLVSFEAAYTEEIEEKEAAMDVDGAEAQEPPKKKKIVRKHEIPFVAHYGSLDSTILNAFKESEANMHAADKLVMDTEDRKNALEEYVYDMRGKLDDRYAAYVQPAEKEATIAALQEAEDWLYSDEGEDATKSVYQERLDKLKVHGDPITFRWKEADERPRVMSALRDTLNGYMAQATSTDEKWSHIDESEKQKVVEKCASISQWLDDKVARQAEKPKNVAPVVTTAEMQAKRDEVIYFATPIFSKPKPKPPVVDPTSGTNTPKQDTPPKEQPPAPETAPPPEPQEMDVD